MTFNYTLPAKQGTVARYIETRIDQLAIEDRVEHTELICKALKRGLKYLLEQDKGKEYVNYAGIYLRIKELTHYRLNQK